MAHSYENMALQAIQFLYRESLEAPDYNSVAATVKAHNLSLRFKRQLLVRALGRLIAKGLVSEEQYVTPLSSHTAKVYFPLSAATRNQRTSDWHSGSLTAIKKKGVVTKGSGSLAMFTLRPPDFRQAWSRIVDCSEVDGTPPSFRPEHVDICVTSQLLFLAHGKDLDCAVQALVESMRKRARPQLETVVSNIRSTFNDSLVSEELVPLSDPTSMLRLECPVRTQHCSHLRAFDLSIHLNLSMLNHRRSGRSEAEFRWQCPLCSKSATWTHLRFDVYVDSILDKTPSTSSTEAVVYPDGNWALAAQAAASRQARTSPNKRVATTILNDKLKCRGDTKRYDDGCARRASDCVAAEQSGIKEHVIELLSSSDEEQSVDTLPPLPSEPPPKRHRPEETGEALPPLSALCTSSRISSPSTVAARTVPGTAASKLSSSVDDLGLDFSSWDQLAELMQAAEDDVNVVEAANEESSSSMSTQRRCSDVPLQPRPPAHVAASDEVSEVAAPISDVDRDSVHSNCDATSVSNADSSATASQKTVPHVTPLKTGNGPSPRFILTRESSGSKATAATANQQSCKIAYPSAAAAAPAPAAPAVLDPLPTDSAPKTQAPAVLAAVSVSAASVSAVGLEVVGSVDVNAAAVTSATVPASCETANQQSCETAYPSAAAAAPAAPAVLDPLPTDSAPKTQAPAVLAAVSVSAASVSAVGLEVVGSVDVNAAAVTSATVPASCETANQQSCETAYPSAAAAAPAAPAPAPAPPSPPPVVIDSLPTDSAPKTQAPAVLAAVSVSAASVSAVGAEVVGSVDVNAAAVTSASVPASCETANQQSCETAYPSAAAPAAPAPAAPAVVVIDSLPTDSAPKTQAPAVLVTVSVSAASVSAVGAEVVGSVDVPLQVVDKSLQVVDKMSMQERPAEKRSLAASLTGAPKAEINAFVLLDSSDDSELERGHRIDHGRSNVLQSMDQGSNYASGSGGPATIDLSMTSSDDD